MNYSLDERAKHELAEILGMYLVLILLFLSSVIAWEVAQGGYPRQAARESQGEMANPLPYGSR